MNYHEQLVVEKVMQEGGGGLTIDDVIKLVEQAEFDSSAVLAIALREAKKRCGRLYSVVFHDDVILL